MCDRSLHGDAMTTGRELASAIGGRAAVYWAVPESGPGHWEIVPIAAMQWIIRKGVFTAAMATERACARYARGGTDRLAALLDGVVL